jgi:aldose 1-epimerase
LDGRTYHLSRNEPDATLHGGERGFDKLFWEVEQAAADHLMLSLVSPDGDQGFPGELVVKARYELAGDTLKLWFEAVASEATPVSLSAHPYFKLAGPAAPEILGHEVVIGAEAFLPTDQHQIPTGEIRAVQGTVFDFRQPVVVGARIRQADPQLLFGKGYDLYFLPGRQTGGKMQFAARAYERQTGRILEILTTQPGIQFYTGNNLNGSVAGRGGAYRQSAGFSFEPQGFPDAPNRPEFPSTILRPGEVYRHSIVYRFTMDQTIS